MSILDHRQQQLEIVNLNSSIDCLQSIEINPIETCNRSCDFCPRSVGYPNQDLYLTQEVSVAINESLKEIQYKGRIGFVGFGEPLLHENLEQCISTVIDSVPAKWIEVNTNGDYLTQDRLTSLEKAGVTHCAISMYDYDATDDFTEIFKNSNIKPVFRHSYDFLENEVNRNDQYTSKERISLSKPCYIPFYKTMIDYNGDVLICANDWTKTAVMGNVLLTPLIDIWNNKIYKEYRKMHLSGNRHCGPCDKCNIDGTVIGEQYFNYFLETSK